MSTPEIEMEALIPSTAIAEVPPRCGGASLQALTASTQPVILQPGLG